jgi:hypothetical protein
MSQKRFGRTGTVRDALENLGKGHLHAMDVLVDGRGWF